MRLFPLTLIAAAALCAAPCATARTLAAAHPALITAMAPSGALPGASSASLAVYSGAGATLQWTGAGPVTQSLPLCVTSTTGRYRLTISSTMGGAALGARRIPYTLTYTDGSGLQQTGSTRAAPQVTFDGSAPAGPECLQGPNATLVITLDEPSLVSGVAGTYGDSLHFTVEAR